MEASIWSRELSSLLLVEEVEQNPLTDDIVFEESYHKEGDPSTKGAGQNIFLLSTQNWSSVEKIAEKSTNRACSFWKLPPQHRRVPRGEKNNNRNPKLLRIDARVHCSGSQYWWWYFTKKRWGGRSPWNILFGLYKEITNDQLKKSTLRYTFLFLSISKPQTPADMVLRWPTEGLCHKLAQIRVATILIDNNNDTKTSLGFAIPTSIKFSHMTNCLPNADMKCNSEEKLRPDWSLVSGEASFDSNLLQEAFWEGLLGPDRLALASAIME